MDRNTFEGGGARGRRLRRQLNEPRPGGSGYGIYDQRYGADGLAVGAQFQLNQITNGDQIESWLGQATALLTNGTLVSTWSGDGRSDTGGVVVRLFDVPVDPTPTPITIRAWQRSTAAALSSPGRAAARMAAAASSAE